MTDRSQLPPLTEREVDEAVASINAATGQVVGDELEATAQFSAIETERNHEIRRLQNRRAVGEISDQQLRQGVDMVMNKALFAVETVVLEHRPKPPPGYGPTRYVEEQRNNGDVTEVEGIPLDSLPASPPLELIRSGFPFGVAVILDIAYRHGQLGPELEVNQLGSQDAETARRILYRE